MTSTPLIVAGNRGFERIGWTVLTALFVIGGAWATSAGGWVGLWVASPVLALGPKTWLVWREGLELHPQHVTAGTWGKWKKMAWQDLQGVDLKASTPQSARRAGAIVAGGRTGPPDARVYLLTFEGTRPWRVPAHLVSHEMTGGEIEARVVRTALDTLWPEFVKDYQSAYELDFGKVGLQRHSGLAFGKETIPIEELVNVELRLEDASMMLLVAGKKQHSIRWHKIRNPHLLVRLVNHIADGSIDRL